LGVSVVPADDVKKAVAYERRRLSAAFLRLRHFMLGKAKSARGMNNVGAQNKEAEAYDSCATMVSEFIRDQLT
jgi:hypothetical protein